MLYHFIGLCVKKYFKYFQRIRNVMRCRPSMRPVFTLSQVFNQSLNWPQLCTSNILAYFFRRPFLRCSQTSMSSHAATLSFLSLIWSKRSGTISSLFDIKKERAHIRIQTNIGIHDIENVSFLSLQYSFLKIGYAGRIRTFNQQSQSLLLYQLSYRVSVLLHS